MSVLRRRPWSVAAHCSTPARQPQETHSHRGWTDELTVLTSRSVLSTQWTVLSSYPTKPTSNSDIKQRLALYIHAVPDDDQIMVWCRCPEKGLFLALNTDQDWLLVVHFQWFYPPGYDANKSESESEDPACDATTVYWTRPLRGPISRIALMLQH